jgi:Polysaccharide pyruvyl transferase.
MKIGIITMNSVNYGNRLQNYALQKALEKYGANVETIHNPFEPTYKDFLYKIKRLIRKIVYRRNEYKYPQVLKEYNFESWNKQYIHFSKYWLNKKRDLKKIRNSYERLVCGSDQVWNSEANQIDGRWFASFADKEQRVSYAASFGLDFIFENRKEEFKKYLEGMDSISVREQSGRKIVWDLIHKEVPCNIDPTMLLKSEEWEEIANLPISLPSRNYVLTYFLGDCSNEINKLVEEIAKVYKLTIIHLNNRFQKELYMCDPSGFLAMLKNANIVITDSFHGTVFSIIFHVPFMVVNRIGTDESMSTRLDNLLSLLKMENRRLEDSINVDNVMNICFDEADDIINFERKKSMEYIRSLFKGV